MPWTWRRRGGGKEEKRRRAELGKKWATRGDSAQRNFAPVWVLRCLRDRTGLIDGYGTLELICYYC